MTSDICTLSSMEEHDSSKITVPSSSLGGCTNLILQDEKDIFIRISRPSN